MVLQLKEIKLRGVWMSNDLWLTKLRACQLINSWRFLMTRFLIWQKDAEKGDGYKKKTSKPLMEMWKRSGCSRSYQSYQVSAWTKSYFPGLPWAFQILWQEWKRCSWHHRAALFKYAGFGNPLSKKLATGLLLWYDKPKRWSSQHEWNSGSM